MLAIAARLEGEARVVHEDRRSILALDRPPVAWRGRQARGLGWSEEVGEVSTSGLDNWERAATDAAACGLVLDGRTRMLHTSVAGIAPVYFAEVGGAVYFASRVDALVPVPTSLSIDWEAWAAILTLDYPLGDRTPFSEIRRLPPYSTLRCRRGRAAVDEHRWPWAEVEPRLDVEEGAPAVVDALRHSMARVPEGPIACQLSGGLDSRMCLALLAEHRRADVTAVTVDPDTPHVRDLEISARVSELVGVPHEIVAGSAEDFWPQFEVRAGRVDYQLVRAPWRMPKLAALRDAAAPVIDGFGFDTIAVPGNRFLTREAIAPDGRRAAVRALFDRLRSGQKRAGSSRWLESELSRALWSSSRRQFLAESERFAGHPARSVLTLYWTRQVRGISMTHGILGSEVPLAMPLVDDAVARAALAITPSSKFGQRLYQAVFEAIDPRLWRLSSTSGGRDTEPVGKRRERRSQSEPVAEALRAAIESGPMAPWVRPHVDKMLSRHVRGKPPRMRRGFIGPAQFNVWHERYRDVLEEIDPRTAIDG